MTRSQIQHAQQTCRHFNGTRNDRCEAGEVYAHFARGIPCITRFGSPETCAKFCAPTEAEVIAEHERKENEMAEIHRQTGAVLPLLVAAKTQGAGRYSYDCPACGKGTLRVSVAPNLHARVCCTTDGCVNWIE